MCLLSTSDQGYMMSIFLFTGDVNRITQFMVVPTRFLPCKVTIFLLVMNKYLGEDT